MLQLHAVSYQHPTAEKPAVKDVSLRVEAGELVLITGPTGCGKSTLLRLAAGLLQRHGRGAFRGAVELEGVDPALATASERVRCVALVGQDPDDQRVSATVGDEIAFAAESAGLEAGAIDAAVIAAMGALGLPGGPERAVAALSSGQRQRLSVAAALAAGAKLLLLDEPLAHLDPQGAAELVERLRALADAGTAVVVVEHRLEPLWLVADRCVVMEEGALVADAAPAAIEVALLRRLGLSVPGWIAVAEAWEGAERRRMEPSAAPIRPVATSPQTEPGGGQADGGRGSGEPMIEATNLSFAYPNGDGLHDVSFVAGGGERLALVGPNGAGKSTLLLALAGELGRGVSRRGRLVAVPPNPDLGLFCPTVREELAYAAAELGLGRESRRVFDLAQAFSLTDLLDRPPQALSRGQRLRVAVAAAVAAEPAVLLLDEPTAGQDLEQVERLMVAVSATLRSGLLVFATHDLALAHRHATRVLVLEAGRVTGDGAPGTTLLEAAERGALALPPLFARCRDLGLPLGPPAAVAASLREAGLEVAAMVPERCGSPRLPPVSGPPLASGAQILPAVGLDPRTRLVLVGLVGVLAVGLEAPWSLAMLMLASMLVFLRFGPSRRTVLGALGMLAAIVWSTVLSQGMFYGDEPRVALASLGPITLWREGVSHGFAQSLRFCAMTLAGFALAASTPPERLFAALRALRVPFGLSFLVVTALRFVPDVAGEWQAVRTARARRGRPAWKRPPWAWLVLEASLLAPVLARTVRRARALAESLDSRGFDASAPRAVRRPLRMRAVDVAILCVATLLTFCVATVRVLFVLYTSDTWYHPGLREFYALARGL
ncbi:hypothetical protein LBMAG42_18460 [Deltaproteobacteria bacterium]|nr:hypothetical protein LBMAG42_18460 [Deltaproteobacteria bacterium]